MGLPIFITPVEPEVAAKSAEKAASGPRSSIRRQRTIRGPHARPSAEIRRRRMLGMIVDTEPEEYEISESRPGGVSAQNETRDAQARSMGWFEQERMRLRDSLSFERQHPPGNEIDGPFMPPVPESRDYSGSEERQREILRLRAVRQDLRRMARRRPAPTPPYTDTDLNYIARNGPGISSPRPSSLTPARSPPYQPPIFEADASPRRPLEDSDFSFTTGIRGPPFADRVARSTLSERVQALNRASNNMERSRRLIRQARLDGLGDRDRSLSPENGAAWDTLLTSITPDPQPPSAGSSFASSAAAAASSSGSGSASASTSMTSVDRNEDSTTLRDCDISESGSNTDEEEEDIYELQDFRTRGDRFWRTYADVVTSRADRAARNGATDTEHLGGMHRIISRLASRDEIPDEWWASAGLSRNLRREPTT
ncbi:hypothetical protein EG329_012210 [Mollisiaceae sp. DMI_Dod_QoI]|nr:hypothetical protein EG329_012210 [Helotiales sp. DMI_Dod_QoI]